jgi:hypothetical protein
MYIAIVVTASRIYVTPSYQISTFPPSLWLQKCGVAVMTLELHRRIVSKAFALCRYHCDLLFVTTRNWTGILIGHTAWVGSVHGSDKR